MLLEIEWNFILYSLHNERASKYERIIESSRRENSSIAELGRIILKSNLSKAYEKYSEYTGWLLTGKLISAFDYLLSEVQAAYYHKQRFTSSQQLIATYDPLNL